MLASPSVTVFNAGLTTKPTIYSDNGTTAIANPFTGNADGSYIFYTANNRVDIVPSKTGFTFTAAETSDVLFYDPANAGGWRVGGLVGQNDGATPNTKYGYSADQVSVFNPTTGLPIVRTNTGTLTNDTGLAGPAANGRDVAGAFAASTWIHFYFIWNGTTLATLSSTTAPPTGPALPTGYTHWAYAGAVFYNATPLLVKTRMRGTWMELENENQVVSNGSAIVETAINLTTIVPPNALRIHLHNGYLLGTTTAGGVINMNTIIRVVTGSNYSNYFGIAFGNNGGNTLQAGGGSGDLFVPNIGQQIFYLVNVVAGTGPSATFSVMGYSVPNGGE